MRPTARLAAARFAPAVLLVLAACGSAPVRYYTLVPPGTTPSASEAVPTDSAPFVIDLLPVGIPSQLDQQQMIVRNGTSGVSVLDDERWEAPLGDEFRAALSSELARRLGTQDVAGLPRPKDKTALGIRVQIRRFDAWLGQSAQLEADWSIASEPGNGAAITCHQHFDAEAHGDFRELVLAQQRLVAQLAHQIARNARSLSEATDHKCAPD